MKGVKKVNLPSKKCPTCGFDFKWRKKWEKNWDNIKYCSKSCQRKKLPAQFGLETTFDKMDLKKERVSLTKWREIYKNNYQ